MARNIAFGTFIPVHIDQEGLDVSNKVFELSPETARALERIAENAKMALFNSRDLRLN